MAMPAVEGVRFAGIGMVLRDSPFQGDLTLDAVAELAATGWG